MSKSLSKSRFIELFGNPTINEKGFPLLTVDDVIKFEGGSQPNKAFFEYEKTENNIRLIQIRDYKTDEYITYIPKDMAKRLCSADDIMIGRYGPPIFQILQGIEGAYNVALMKAIPKKGNKDFIRSWLKQDCLLKYLEALSGRTAGQDGIQMDKLKAYPFPYPPIELQDQWVKIDKQIDKSKFILQKMIEKLELLKKSRFVEMFGNIKETIPLENCCSLISDFVASGSFASLRDNVKYYDKENYAVLVRTIDFANNFSKDLVYTDKHGYDFLSKTNLYGGEILLSNIGASIGKVFRVPYLNKPMTLAPNSIVIKPNDNYTNEFLEYFFSIGRGQDELHVMTTATATPKFNKTQLRQVPVPKVSKEIQNDFSCFVKQLDKSKLILQKQLEDLVGETK